MRALTSAINRYVPSEPPSDPKALAPYLQQELGRIAAMLALVAEGQLEVTHVVPPKPRDGMIRYFDGTDANPIAGGEGIYAYYRGAWTKL